ncbi:MAG: RNA methyltransferase [Deltaproteobacteria bacterium]|nr:MAG: RNA methyltransferase [Deltaproteobacteria bacterium]
MTARRFFATTFKGLEEVLAGEIAALGGEEVSIGTGSVSFSGDLALCYRANLWLRSANRVVMLLSEFSAPTPAALYEGVRDVPWPELFPPERTIAVDATVRDSGITHSHFAAQKTKDAVVDRFRDSFGKRPDVDPKSPDVRIVVRIVHDVCSVSLDTSGESLHRRGYRTHPTEASLKETLAAGLVLLAGWQGEEPLVDPACGAGTIPIEAALIAGNIAPGSLGRSFGFQRLRDFDRKRWEILLSEAGDAARHPHPVRIEGSDVSPGAVAGSIRNATNAKVSERVLFNARSVRFFSPGDGPGTILCNPPYGTRLPGGEEAESFYREMGEALKKRCRGWTAYILSGNAAVTRFLGLKASRRFPVMNGPIDCRLLKYELY